MCPLEQLGLGRSGCVGVLYLDVEVVRFYGSLRARQDVFWGHNGGRLEVYERVG